MNQQKILTALFFVLLCSLSITKAAVVPKDFIGFSVIKDPENPIQYSTSPFAENPVTTFNLNRLQGERDIYNFLSYMNVGKQVVNYLLNYQLSKMDDQRLRERMPNNSQTKSEDDYRTIIINNYLLVVKMDEKSRRKALLGDTIRFAPTGNWYLYQLQCDDSTYTNVRRNIIYPSDKPDVKGEKRVRYESITIPIKLVSTGTDINPKIVQQIAKGITYETFRDNDHVDGVKRTGKTKTALKVALSPLMILKK
jgi:hypothetical protein